MTVFKLTWTDHLDELLPAALDLLPTTPDRLGCKLSVETGTPLELELLGQLVGTEAELRALLAPLYRIEAPGEEIISTLSYWDAQGILAEDENDQYTHERSRYAFKPIPAEGSRTVLDFLRKWPGTHDTAVWKMFLAGGAVASIAPEVTAFVHREALMLTTVDLDWTAEDDEATVARNEAWLGEFHDAMQPFTSDQSYQNFIDGAETNYLRAYYGAKLELGRRLAQIRSQQSVSLSPEHPPLAIRQKPSRLVTWSRRPSPSDAVCPYSPGWLFSPLSAVPHPFKARASAVPGASASKI